MSERAARFPLVGDGSGLESSLLFHREELQLAFRNRGMPLEALRYDVTPTGMHYLLTHFDIPDLSEEEWRLQVGGSVSRPLSLTLSDIRALPARTLTVTMECAGNGRGLLHPRPVTQPWLYEAIGTARWTGAPLATLLTQAGVGGKAKEILFTGADRGVQGGEIQHYQRSLSLAEAMREEVLLAYEMNGARLEPQHGFPLRLLVPGWYGMTSVKWLEKIEAIDEVFAGYQMIESYRYSESEEDPGDAVTLMRVKSLMAPPGVPDFLTRTRLVSAGAVTVRGRAWAGRNRIVGVEFSDDDGRTWVGAELGPELSPHSWRSWSCRWQARPGRHVLRVRATDGDGNTQPIDPPWNQQGMGVNVAQRVAVMVE